MNLYAKCEATGHLVSGGDREWFSTAARKLVADEPLRKQLGENAYHDARRRFSGSLKENIDFTLKIVKNSDLSTLLHICCAEQNNNCSRT